ncbi:MAG: DUF3391 domain-containing protein [Chromatiales bacterium]|nr:DUF3391 domain-containing protein [Chromatiales bacterium]
MKSKVDTKDLQIGMYVSELDRPWLETPFLFQGFRISSKGDINELTHYCKFVYIDEEKSDYEKELIPQSTQNNHASRQLPEIKVRFPEHKVPIEEEMSEARKIRAVAEQQISELLNQSKGGKALDIQQANVVVKNITQSLMRSPDAMVLLSSIKSHEREAEAHAMNTCILSITLGRFMRFSPKMVDELGLAALLHDVGEVKIPTELLHKEKKSPEELAQVKRHTEFGAHILMGAKGMPESVIEVAYSHHEQIDGKGYPRGLTAEGISAFSRIVTIVETYDRLTQGYNEKRISATEALRYLYLYRDKIFDARITEAFIKCLGIYPVGSLVELETGEVGIVISAQPGEFLHPRLMLVRDRKKSPFDKPRIMNLATFAKSDPGKYVVKQVLPPDAYGVDMRSYLLSEDLISA